MRAKEIAVIIPTKDVFVGDPKAPVTLMEYGDYESEACAKVNEVGERVMWPGLASVVGAVCQIPRPAVPARSTL